MKRATKTRFKVKTIHAQFVKLYLKSNRYDVIDAEVICESISRPNMHFVIVKTK